MSDSFTVHSIPGPDCRCGAGVESVTATKDVIAIDLNVRKADCAWHILRPPGPDAGRQRQYPEDPSAVPELALTGGKDCRALVTLAIRATRRLVRRYMAPSKNAGGRERAVGDFVGADLTNSLPGLTQMAWPVSFRKSTPPGGPAGEFTESMSCRHCPRRRLLSAIPTPSGRAARLTLASSWSW